MRWFLTGCGALLVAAPILWIFYFFVHGGLMFWYAASYPSHNEVFVFVISWIPGTMMVLVGLDIIQTQKYRK